MVDKAAAKEAKDKGNAAFKAQDYQKAIDYFSEAIAADPTDHVLYSNRSGAYASAMKYEAALADANSCIRIEPNWAKGYSRKGLAEFHLGDMQMAKATYEQGLKLDPNNEALKTGLKQVEEKEGSGRLDAQTLYQLALALDKNPNLKQYVRQDPSYYTNLLGILKESQNNPSSLSSALLHMDPRIREGVLAFYGIDLPKSEEVASSPPPQRETAPPEKEKTATEVEAETWKKKGNELYKRRRFNEAIEAYDKAIELNPKEILYISNKAAVYVEMGEYDQCIELCNKAIEDRYEMHAPFTGVAKVYNRLASCYEKMMDYDQSIAMYEKSLMEDNTRQTRTLLKAVQRKKEHKLKMDYIDPELAEQHRRAGNDYFNNGAYPDAKKEYDEAILRNPKDAKLYSNRAAAFAKLLEYPSAVKDCDTAIELDPKFIKAYVRKGNMQMLMKDYTKALKTFDQGLSMAPDNVECLLGKQQVMAKVSVDNSSEEPDKERLNRAMADPEIQKILADPQFNIILQNITENPQSITDYMRDPKVASGLQKLIAAGFVRLGSN